MCLMQAVAGVRSARRCEPASQAFVEGVEKPPRRGEAIKAHRHAGDKCRSAIQSHSLILAVVTAVSNLDAVFAA
jgi:hypothetical protein